MNQSAIGVDVPLIAGISLCNGEALFVDDRPLLPREVLVGVVGAPVAKGKLTRVHTEKALNIPGVIAIFTARDFPYSKNYGPIVADQPLLVHEDISYFGEAVALVAAETQKALDAALLAVEVVAEASEPILTMASAITAQSFLGQPSVVARGAMNVEAPHHLSGTFVNMGQDHFYLESQASVAYPLEGGAMEIHASTQHPSELQHWAAAFLGLGYHQVTAVVKRMGGAFGGKESQSNAFGVMAALVAQKLNRPARLILTKDEDMQMTGGRHPMQSQYEVGFDCVGRILTLQVQVYADGGAFVDLSPAILDRALFHLDGCYYLPNVLLKGQVLKTNKAPNTAFRGFGGPQGTAIIEHILSDIALFLGRDGYDVRRINLYGDGRLTTPYGQVVEKATLETLFDRLRVSSEYDRRRKEIARFNQENRGKVRGLAVTGSKFGISFTNRMLNQGNAHVLLHLDGTVQVATGATEMGQGVKTKIAQVIAEVFQIPLASVTVLATRTDQNPNTSPTAASSGSDINGFAALNAAALIVRRLLHCALLSEAGSLSPEDEIHLPTEPIEPPPGVSLSPLGIVGLPSGKTMPLKKAIQIAYQNRINLAAHGHYKTPGIYYDRASGRGQPFLYFTQGAAVAEVEVDLFTGQYEMIRTDILMDLGRPLNPGIDEGQVRGAFIQAQGWVTTESLFYDKKGVLLSHSPTTYKIPGVYDVPSDFRVAFLEGVCAQNLYGSKAVGEPPFLLGLAVLFALKDAISSRRSGPFTLGIPATGEAVLRAIT